MRSKWVEVYGLPTGMMPKFIFDGQALEWKDTPDSLEMEDDDIVEVKVRSLLLSATFDVEVEIAAACCGIFSLTTHINLQL